MSMEAGNSAAPAGARSGGGGASADSYIGSFISLTSKSEIRYEGILYSINTEEASIGLCNVRSFGTEGRKKDGPQVPAIDKIFEFILFKGSDIKDLQVKASPPVHATPSINSDPAIIQSHYPHPAPAPAPAPPPTASTVPSGSLSDHGPHSAPAGLSGLSFQSGLPLYQPGGTLNSWDPSSNANGSGLAMPMYWQGFYGTPNLPQLPQQPVLRPPPGLPIPPMQQMQLSGYNSSLPTSGFSLPSSNIPDLYSNLAHNVASSSTATSTLHGSTVPLNMAPLQYGSSASEMINPLPNKSPLTANSTSAPSSILPSLSHLSTSGLDNARLPSLSSKPSPIAGPTALPQSAISQPGTSISGPAGSVLTETSMPSLVTPGQLLYVGPASVSAPQPSQIVQKDVEVVQVSSGPSSEPSIQEVKEAQPPILPLPSSSLTQTNGGAYHAQNNYRGRGGRGSAVSHPVTNFTEEFDFMAMNEKFNKDEVWGYLGKSNMSQPKDDEGNGSGGYDYLNMHEDELPKIEMKPVYNKDDFFDSLSCNALDNNPHHGWTRYSEQMKLDTETFGDFPRYRGGRGRGGGRFRGSYHGRGGYGGYWYAGRGRGRGRGGGRFRGSYHGRGGYGGYWYAGRGRGRGM